MKPTTRTFLSFRNQNICVLKRNMFHTFALNSTGIKCLLQGKCEKTCCMHVKYSSIPQYYTGNKIELSNENENKWLNCVMKGKIPGMFSM